MSVSAAATMPPVQLSAVAMVHVARAGGGKDCRRRVHISTKCAKAAKTMRADTGKQAGPKVVNHHPIRIAARIGAAHKPRFPDVKEPEQQEGGDPAGIREDVACKADIPKAEGREQQGDPHACHFINHDF